MPTNRDVAAQQREQLMRAGFCVFADVLPPELLTELRCVTDRMLDAQTADEQERQRSTGSMISVREDPLFADLIALSSARDALASLGFPEPKFTSGFVISKPPHSPPLFWHYDWAGWDDPGGFDPLPQQVFLMYYLVDTNRENGCLRVIPGTHTRHHPLIDRLAEAHSDELRAARDLGNPAFAIQPDEVDVPVRAGDVVIGDSRLLHAAHANETDRRRTVITLWYHPAMTALDERTQAFIARMAAGSPEAWPAEKRALVEPLWARYAGDAEPLPWNRLRPKGPQ